MAFGRDPKKAQGRGESGAVWQAGSGLCDSCGGAAQALRFHLQSQAADIGKVVGRKDISAGAANAETRATSATAEKKTETAER